MDYSALTPSLQDTYLSLEENFAHLLNFHENQRDLGCTFEVSWEVANNVGGVYPLLRSRAAKTVSELGENYYMIGPICASSFKDVEIVKPNNTMIQETLNAVKERGINVVFGRWLIEGSPNTILIDLDSTKSQLESWKTELTNELDITIPGDDQACLSAIQFSYAAAIIVEEARKRVMREQKIICHCHEWVAGMAIIPLLRQGSGVRTIYTSHGPILGRYLCSMGKAEEYYSSLPTINGDKEAKTLGVLHQHKIEKFVTHNCRVLSAISRIVAGEVEYVSGKRPQIILPNGLNCIKFEALHQFQNLHAEAKEKIHDFVLGHFHGSADFKLDNVRYFFSSGRYDFFNKGVDVLIEALGKLNQKLKESKSESVVVMFLLFPKKETPYHPDCLRAQGVTNQLRDAVKLIEEKVANRILESAYSGKMPDLDSLLDHADEMLLKRCIQSAQRNTAPPVTTHVLKDEKSDLIFQHLTKVGLLNARDDKVKIIFHPRFLSKANPLFGIDYEEFVRGCHLGIFPGLYEPWGYTPAETSILGVPVVTSNLTGFGSFLEDQIPQAQQQKAVGIYVLDRRNHGREYAVNQLCDFMSEFCNQTRKQRIIQRNLTEKTLGKYLDWSVLSQHYATARALALQ